jgi:hypothetical protein
MGLQWNLHAQTSRADELARVLRSRWGAAHRLVTAERSPAGGNQGPHHSGGIVSAGLGASVLVLD